MFFWLKDFRIFTETNYNLYDLVRITCEKLATDKG